ncbi:hypothetical protein MFIFM68171_08030 [Madurella fahalii]|uniref:C2H2-type domain-containing protein n=1 Tax=Madurella fahalii TaxID=1157608 RepID=A0ABQ0GJU1_9PEZI
MHDHEVCAIRSWPTISRLKEHLYRRHYKIHCQRCKQTFNDARELTDHEMSALGCEVIDIDPPGDITTYQEKQLKSRKHGARRQTEEEKWADIYRLLFPDEEQIPSPYPEVAEDFGPISSESRVCLDFQHFLLAEMPRLFTQTAEEHAGRHIQAHEGLTMESIPRIIEDSLQKAFRTWEARRSSSVSTREASIASMSFRQDAPPSRTYTYGQPQPTSYLTTQAQAGMDHGFAHSDFGSSAPFTPDAPQASQSGGIGLDAASFFTSAPPTNYYAFASQYPRGTWEAGLAPLSDGALPGDPNLEGHFQGYQHH